MNIKEQWNTWPAFPESDDQGSGLTRREYLIAAIAGPALLTPAVGDKEIAGKIYAARVVNAADAIIDELQRRDAKPPVVRED